jgi:hypothetical protein
MVFFGLEWVIVGGFIGVGVVGLMKDIFIVI